jgi:Domain of unknown function (DUF3850)
MKVHELKIWPSYFHDVCIGLKTFEYRKNDRNFQEGDILLLREFDPNRGDSGEYLGGEIIVIVAKIYSDPKIGISDGYVIMQIKRLKVED